MAVCVCVSTNARADSPKRIGSTSLCGDAYLRVLAPEKIAALSWQSRDAVSLASESEKTLPQLWDDPENLLASNVDHILFGPGEGFRSGAFLDKTSALTWGEDFEAIKANYKSLGLALGINAKPVIFDLETRLAKLKHPTIKPSILYLDRSGGSAGPGTFVHAVIEAAGGENLMTTAGWVKPDPEIVLSLEPDLILTSYFNDGYESVNALPIRHTALKHFIEAHERIEIPGALWPCAGPGLIEAAERLNTKIRSLP